MGVHGLWPVLSPASQSIPLSRLAGRTLAVDLSGWVCQANKTKVNEGGGGDGEGQRRKSERECEWADLGEENERRRKRKLHVTVK